MLLNLSEREAFEIDAWRRGGLGIRILDPLLARTRRLAKGGLKVGSLSAVEIRYCAFESNS